MRSFYLALGLLLTGFGAVAQAIRAPRAAYRSAAHPVAAARPTAQDVPREALRQVWKNTAWFDTTRIRYTRYDAAGRNLALTTEERVNAAWNVRSSRTQTYNAQGQDVIDTLFSGLGNPLFAFRRVYTPAGRPDTLTVRFRIGNVWRYSSRDAYTYDANGYPLRLLWQGNSGGWYNQTQFLYTTDPQGRVVVDEEQTWNSNTASWLPSTRLTYTYTAADSIATAEYAEWRAGAYAARGRSRARYNAQNQLDSIYNEPYDTLQATYRLGGVTTYTYDATGNRTVELIRNGPTVATQVNTARRLFTYAPLGRVHPAAVLTGLGVAPNPAHGTATLHYELPPLTDGRPVEIDLLDVLGRSVAGVAPAPVRYAAGPHRVPLALGAVAPGVYLVRVRTATTARQLRLVVQ